jgi:hypothetical protein
LRLKWKLRIDKKSIRSFLLFYSNFIL